MNWQNGDGLACACGALASIIVVIRAESLKAEGLIDVACDSCIDKVYARGLSKLKSEEKEERQ